MGRCEGSIRDAPDGTLWELVDEGSTIGCGEEIGPISGS